MYSIIIIFLSILYITFYLLYNYLYYNLHILVLVKNIFLFNYILSCTYYNNIILYINNDNIIYNPVNVSQTLEAYLSKLFVYCTSLF